LKKLTGKGDERKPQCRHCEKSGRECEYDCDIKSSRRNSNGVNGGFHFSPDHVWLNTPSEGRKDNSSLTTASSQSSLTC
jgi:hypothetical protein